MPGSGPVSRGREGIINNFTCAAHIAEKTHSQEPGQGNKQVKFSGAVCCCYELQQVCVGFAAVRSKLHQLWQEGKQIHLC